MPPEVLVSCLLCPAHAALAGCRLLPVPHGEAAPSAPGRDCDACGVAVSSVKPGANCCYFQSKVSSPCYNFHATYIYLFSS